MANLGLLNKNPGNLRDPRTGNFQVFNTEQEGRGALEKDLQYKLSGQSKHIKPGGTILDLAKVWAPASDGNVPENWARNVANAIGADINTKWDSIPVEKLADGIQVAEGTSTAQIKKAPIGSYASNNTQMDTNTKKMTPAEFAERVFSRKGEAYRKAYSDMSPEEFTTKYLIKKPMYRDMVDTSSMNIGTFGTKPGDTIAENVIDNSATRYIKEKVQDGTVLDKVGNVVNRMTKPFTDLAAIPVQLGVAGYNKLTGSNVQDPYRKGIPALGYEKVNEVNPIIDIKGKAGSALEVGAETLAAMTGGKLISLARGTSLLRSPSIIERLPKGMTEKMFSQLGKTEKANLLGDMLKTAMRTGAEGDVPIITKALAKVTGNTGLFKSILKKVIGSKFGATDLLGLKEGYDLVKGLFR